MKGYPLENSIGTCLQCFWLFCLWASCVALFARSKYGLLNIDHVVSANVLWEVVPTDLEKDIVDCATIVAYLWALDVVGLETMLDDVICVLLAMSQTLNQEE